jgi:hypothetical protein
VERSVPVGSVFFVHIREKNLAAAQRLTLAASCIFTTPISLYHNLSFLSKNAHLHYIPCATAVLGPIEAILVSLFVRHVSALKTGRSHLFLALFQEEDADPSPILGHKPSPLKRQHTHGGEHSPAWRTSEPLVPSERLMTSSEDSGEDEPDLYNALENDVDLNVGLDHARHLIAAHKRLKYLRLEDFIVPSRVVIAPKVHGDIESEVIGEGAQGTIFRAFIRGSGSQIFAVKCGDSKSILQEFSLSRKFNHESTLNYPFVVFFSIFPPSERLRPLILFLFLR